MVKLNALQKRANFQEKFHSVLFLFVIRIIVHLLKKLVLDAVKFIAEYVLQNLLMKRSNQLHDCVACRVVDETRHCGVLQKCKFVAQMDAPYNVLIVDRNHFFELHFRLQEVAEARLDPTSVKIVINGISP
jgi:hypothetical protein